MKAGDGVTGPASGLQPPALAAASGATRAALADALARGEATALSCQVMLGPEPAFAAHLGRARAYVLPPGASALRPAAASPPLTAEHVFDVASLSKVVATCTMVMTLVGDGKLALDAPVAQLLPLPRSPGARQLTVRDLLAHRGGLPAWLPLYFDVDRADALLPALAPYVAVAVPGKARVYSDLGYLLLGAIVERTAGARLDTYFAQRVAAPLAAACGPLRAGYTPKRSGLGPQVATGHGNVYERRMVDEPDFGLALPSMWPQRSSHAFAGWRRGSIEGEVDDGNAHYAMGGIAGHAGLFADAASVTRLARALAGPAQGPEALALAVPAAVRSAFAAPSAASEYLGWSAGAIGQGVATPPGCLFMRGFTGCIVVYSPTRDVTVAVLGNRQHPSADGHYANLAPVFGQVLRTWLGTAVSV